MIKLYPHQQKIVDSNRTKLLLCHSTGTGKTITSIALCNKYLSEDDYALVVVPKALKEKWQRDMHTFSTHLYTIMTKEEFKKHAKDLPPYRAVVIDEGHYFAGIKSQMSKLMYWYLNKHDIPYRFIATATPYLSTPLNIYTLARLLGHEWNYRTFTNKFFYEVPMGLRRVLKIKPNIEEQIAQLVKEIGDVVDMDEVVEVPEQSFSTVYFDMTEQQKEEILKIYEPQFIVEWTRKSQVENGFLYMEGEETKIIENGKVGYILQIAKENPKIAVLCRYTAQLHVLKQILEENGHTVYLISGEVKDRDSVVMDIEATQECVALIQADSAVGFEIPSVPIMIFASLSFSYVSYAQSLGRIHRINKLKENKYIHLITKGGVDEDVYNSIIKKQDFSFEIYGKK